MRRIVLSLVVASLLTAIPAGAGAAPPSGTVDYEQLWEAFPLEEPTNPAAPEGFSADDGTAQKAPASAEAATDEAPAAATAAEPDNGSGAIRLVEFGLVALGLLLIAAAFVRNRRRRARSAVEPETGRAEAQPAAAAEACEDTPGIFSEFAEGLSDEVLERSIVLFERLDRDSAVGAQQLVSALRCEPSELSGMLLTPLRRRANAVGLALPYEAEVDPASRRRVWRDEAGLASDMYAALVQERTTRTEQGGPSAGPAAAGPPGPRHLAA